MMPLAKIIRCTALLQFGALTPPAQAQELPSGKPAECAKYLRSEMAFYSKLIKDAGIKPE